MRVLYALLLLFAVTLAAAVQSDAQSCADSVEGPAAGQLAQGSGCCKGHKGICGCRAGKITCCDKSIDTSCLCAKDEPLTTL